MLDFLYFQSNLFVGALFVVVAISIAMTLMLGLRAVLPVRDDKETFDITIRVMPTVLSLTAFVLGFSVVQANSEMARASRVAVDEATAIGQLDRLLLRIDAASTLPARTSLAAYARSIVADEWPYMRAGNDGFGHETTRARLAAFVATLGDVEAADTRRASLVTEVEHAIDQIEDLRDTRLREARESVPVLFWATIGVLTLLMMSLGAFLRPTLTNLIMVAGQAAAVGLLSSFLFIIDRPFMGESGITPFMMERVLRGMSVER